MTFAEHAERAIADHPKRIYAHVKKSDAEKIADLIKQQGHECDVIKAVKGEALELKELPRPITIPYFDEYN